jgi:hypothetical protein
MNAVAGSEAVSALSWAVLAAIVLSALLGVLTYYVSASKATRDRRRELYSGAFRAAMSWVEMVYRVRRRSVTLQDELVMHLHRVQEDIAYYEGWLSTEAPELGRSYATLVATIRTTVRPLIREAWSHPAQPPWKGTPTGEEEPDVGLARRQFLQDVHDHLSRWWWVRRRVRVRYRASR